MGEEEFNRRWYVKRLVLLFGLPVLGLVGIAVLIRYDIEYPNNVALGLALFGLVWFWFRSLGRFLETD